MRNNSARKAKRVSCPPAAASATPPAVIAEDPRLVGHSIMLGQIAHEVSDYCPHHECTTLQAVQLMKCRLQEFEIAATRRQIVESWRD